MASFLHVLKDIGKFALAADRVAAPIVTMIDPPVGAAMNAIGALVVKAEQTYPALGSGQIKKAAVNDWFFALFPMFQALLKDQGFSFTVNADAVDKLIDASVAQLNAAGALKNSFKLEKVS